MARTTVRATRPVRADPQGHGVPGRPGVTRAHREHRAGDRDGPREAVRLDAFPVRLVLLPVLLRLTGRAARAAPGWLHRVLPGIRFPHG